MIGERTAEDIKITIGAAFPKETETILIRGRFGFRFAISIEITSTKLFLHLEPVSQIIDAIKYTLEKHHELAADIMESGIMLTVGGLY